MRTLYVLRGLPASGKSTFARDLLKREGTRWRRINRDDLRGMLDDHAYDARREDFIRLAQDTLVRTAFNEGYDVVLDNTSLVPTTVKKLHRLAEQVGDVKVIEKCFNVPVDECLRRNALRTGTARVPDDVIHKMAKAAGIDRGRKLEDREAYYPPHSVRGDFVQDDSLPKAILCDLDGTLALIGDRSPYDATNCDKDLPHWPVIECVKAMHAHGRKIIFMSGREDRYRAPTERFIQQYVTFKSLYAEPYQPAKDLVIPYELHMRPSGDQRKDSIVKRELFDAHVAGKYFVEFVLDDRPQVVRMWRYELGLTVMALADKEF